ncbi:MAG: IclR family transcriptional regulator [Nocardioidaceae bacterium]
MTASSGPGVPTSASTSSTRSTSSTDSPPHTAADAPRNNSSSLRRALTILQFISDYPEPEGATLSELGRALGLTRSTLLRLLAPLRDVRLVERDTGSGRYRLGPYAARLGDVYLERLDLRRVARDVLVDLAQRTGETVHLVEFDPPYVVYIDKVESVSAVRMYSRIGSRQPAYCTGVGKAYLAFASEDVLATVVQAGLERRTANTLTTEPDLRDALESIRGRGFAIDDSENEAEIRCAAAPVFDHTGSVLSAVSVAGPAWRITPDRDEMLGDLVTRAAKEISSRLAAPR